MDQGAGQDSVALIVGVTGMVGLSLAEALKKPTTPGAPWKVYGVARRPRPSWFSPSTIDSYIELDTLDSQATHQKLSPLSIHVTHVFWVAVKWCPTEEENIAANSSMLSNVLQALMLQPNPRLRHIALQTGTMHYMGPFMEPALARQITPHETPFREDYARLPVPSFYYAQEDLLASYPHKFTWSVHRASIIFGASSRSTMNMFLFLAVYASICRHERSLFKFPGNQYTWEHFCDASDAELLAEQQIWAGTTDEAKNQAFNCSNGDVFTWKSIWKVVAEIFEIGFLPPGSTADMSGWVGEMKSKGAVWDAIVEENGLYKTKLEDISNLEAIDGVFKFKFQHVCGMNKSKDFGFFGYRDTLKSVGKWVESLREMNLIPKK